MEGCEGVLYQVAETLPAEVLAKMGAPPKAADVPVISVDDLPKADGFLFGIPTRCAWTACGSCCATVALTGVTNTSHLGLVLLTVCLTHCSPGLCPDGVVPPSHLSPRTASACRPPR